MNANELEALLTVLMCADPWPFDTAHETILKDFADEQAREHGYDNWIDAYHHIGPEAANVRQDSGQFGVGA